MVRIDDTWCIDGDNYNWILIENNSRKRYYPTLKILSKSLADLMMLKEIINYEVDKEKIVALRGADGSLIEAIAAKIEAKIDTIEIGGNCPSK